MTVHATPSERFDRAEGSSPLRSDRAYYDPRLVSICPLSRPFCYLKGSCYAQEETKAETYYLYPIL
jgi:hypothetical protein